MADIGHLDVPSGLGHPASLEPMPPVPPSPSNSTVMPDLIPLGGGPSRPRVTSIVEREYMALHKAHADSKISIAAARSKSLILGMLVDRQARIDKQKLKKKKKKKKKKPEGKISSSIQLKLLKRVHNIRVSKRLQREKQLRADCAKPHKNWTPQEIFQHIKTHGVVLKNDAYNYIEKDDTVPSGTSKSGCVFQQNPNVVLLFKKIKRTFPHRNLTRKQVQDDVELLQSVHDDLTVLPEVYTDCFDLTVNGVATFGFLMRCITSMMVEPYKPQAHKQSYKFIQGRLKLLTLQQLERAYQDVKTISDYTVNVKFIHDLQLLLQDVGEDTGRIFVIDPGEVRPTKGEDQTQTLGRCIGGMIKNRMATLCGI